MDWHDMTTTEVKIIKDLVKELKDVPRFAVRLVEQTLTELLDGD